MDGHGTALEKLAKQMVVEEIKVQAEEFHFNFLRLAR